MNIFKFLQAVEALIYELVLWIILVPRTYFKCIFSPLWMQDYVAKELEKPAEERFNEYISPILLWVITGIIPILFILNTTSAAIQQDYANSKFLERFFDLSDETKLILAVLLFVTFPLGFSVILSAYKKERVTRNSLLFRRIFYVQCYRFAPLQVFYYFFFLSSYIKVNIGRISSTAVNVFLISLLTVCYALYFWHIFVEMRTIRKELTVGRFAAFKIYLYSTFVSTLIAYIILVVVIGFVFGTVK